MTDRPNEAEAQMDEAVAKGVAIGASPKESALALLLRVFYDQHRGEKVK